MKNLIEKRSNETKELKKIMSKVKTLKILLKKVNLGIIEEDIKELINVMTKDFNKKRKMRRETKRLIRIEEEKEMKEKMKKRDELCLSDLPNEINKLISSYIDDEGFYLVRRRKDNNPYNLMELKELLADYKLNYKVARENNFSNMECSMTGELVEFYHAANVMSSIREEIEYISRIGKMHMIKVNLNLTGSNIIKRKKKIGSNIIKKNKKEMILPKKIIRNIFGYNEDVDEYAIDIFINRIKDDIDDLKRDYQLREQKKKSEVWVEPGRGMMLKKNARDAIKDYKKWRLRKQILEM